MLCYIYSGLGLHFGFREAIIEARMYQLRFNVQKYH